MTTRSLIIAWASHSMRIDTMARELHGKASLQYAQNFEAPWLLPFRYIAQAWKTWRLLEREQPDVVVIQAPPIFAPLVVAFWCRMRGRKAKRSVPYVIDAHTGAFYDPRWRWALPLLRRLARRAATTLVTDAPALSMLSNWGVGGLFLPNDLPALSPATGSGGSEGSKRVAVISTFSDVEPIEEVFGAARLLPDVTFYVTGDTRRASSGLLAQRPENVILTGFLRDGNYTALLENAHCLAILTKEPNALSCGAYEALAVAKPVVASEGPEMQNFFTRGFVYVANTPEAIADGIRRMLDEQEAFTAEIIAMRSEFLAKRQPEFEKFVAILQGNALEGSAVGA